VKAECSQLKGKGNGQKSEVNVATSCDDDVLLMSVSSSVESWILDSDASFHCTSNRDIFENYKRGDFSKVYLANGDSLDIEGKGTVQCAQQNGQRWKLNEVRHIPGLAKNMISVHQLDVEGHRVTFECGKWKVCKGAIVVARGIKSSTLYLTDTPTAAVASNTVDSATWHCRLGHISEKGLQVMKTKGKLPGLESIKLELCESCIFGKQTCISFGNSKRQLKTQKLELVHSDVWGPAPVASMGGARYYVTFIDDSTRKVWIYFLKHKSDVFETFKVWRSLVENKTGLKLKCLRVDNGGEYESQGFKQYCSTNGI